MSNGNRREVMAGDRQLTITAYKGEPGIRLTLMGRPPFTSVELDERSALDLMHELKRAVERTKPRPIREGL